MLKLSKTATDILNLIKELEENKDRYILVENNNSICGGCIFIDTDYCEFIECGGGIYKKIETITREEAIKAMIDGKKVRPLRYKNYNRYACYDPNYFNPFRWVVGEENNPIEGLWQYKEWIIVG